MRETLYHIIDRRAFAVVVALLLVGGVLLMGTPESDAINSCTTGYRIGGGRTISCSGLCRVVSKSGGSDFLVPTRTQDEYGSFVSDKPYNANVSACAAPTTDGIRWRCHYCGGGCNTTSWVCGTGTPSDGISYSFCNSSSQGVVEAYCSTLCNNSQC